MFPQTRNWIPGLWTALALSFILTFLTSQFGLVEGQTRISVNASTSSGSSSECRPDGLSIRCLKTGYEADTLTLTNTLKCYDGARCVPYYYSISVFYSRCGYPGKNVKNYTNRFLRPFEAYSYHFAKANKQKCLEYVIHSCSRNSRNSRPVDCSSVFGITRY